MTDRPDPLAPPEGYGSQPARTSRQPAVNDDEVLDVCSAGDWGCTQTIGRFGLRLDMVLR